MATLPYLDVDWNIICSHDLCTNLVFDSGNLRFCISWLDLSIGKVTYGLNGKNRIDNYREDLWFLLLFISIIPFGYFSHSLRPTNGFLMFGTIIFESVVGFKLVNFSAKAICQFEKKKNLKFGDYVSEFLMIIFLPIGVWKLQPRLNKIIERKILNKSALKS